MDDDGKEGEDAMNEMFALDNCSFSVWGATEGGGKIEVGATEAEIKENGEEMKKRKQSDELRNAAKDNERQDEPIGNADGNENGQVAEAHTHTERKRRKMMRDLFTTLQCLVPHLTSKSDKSTIVEETMKYIRFLEQNLQILQDKKGEKSKASNSNNTIILNPFAASSSFNIPPQRQPNQHHKQLHLASTDLISRASLLADHYHYYSSSSTSITPTNSNPTTPRSNLTSPLGSPFLSLKNNNENIPREASVKLRLAPSSITFDTFASKNVVVNVWGRDAQFTLCGARKPGFYTGICLVLEKFQLEVKSFQISSDEGSNLTMVTILACATALLDRYPVEEIYKAAGSEMMIWVCHT